MRKSTWKNCSSLVLLGTASKISFSSFFVSSVVFQTGRPATSFNFSRAAMSLGMSGFKIGGGGSSIPGHLPSSARAKEEKEAHAASNKKRKENRTIKFFNGSSEGQGNYTSAHHSVNPGPMEV